MSCVKNGCALNACAPCICRVVALCGLVVRVRTTALASASLGMFRREIDRALDEAGALSNVCDLAFALSDNTTYVLSSCDMRPAPAKITL